jgi:hypothetical protein
LSGIPPYRLQYQLKKSGSLDALRNRVRLFAGYLSDVCTFGKQAKSMMSMIPRSKIVDRAAKENKTKHKHSSALQFACNIMSSIRFVARALRAPSAFARSLSTAPRLMATAGNAQEHPTAADHRKIQTEKPLGPHMTNTNSTIANKMPSAGAGKVPPEFITSVNPDYVPKDSVPENTERMTGGTQDGAPSGGPNAELGVGELEGAEFRVEPLRRTGEDLNTMRARLLCPQPLSYPYYFRIIH